MMFSWAEALAQHLKAEARAVQYNLELAVLNDYRNHNIRNLRGPPNTDNHSEYLKDVKDISWSYPGKIWIKHAMPTESDKEPLSNQADEPKTKSRKRDLTLDLIILGEDDSTPCPGRSKVWERKPVLRAMMFYPDLSLIFGT